MKRLQDLGNDDVRILENVDAFAQLSRHVYGPGVLVVEPQGGGGKALLVLGQGQLSHAETEFRVAGFVGDSSDVGNADLISN
jgi:hypothetical protein